MLEGQSTQLDEGTKVRLAARKDMELRMQCLQLAVTVCSRDGIIAEAEKFLSFVTGHVEKS